MTTPFLGECLGTLILILLGDGVVACVLLKRSKGEASGWIVITAGWAFAVMAGVFAAIACGSKDAFLNPAVTLGFAISSGDYSKLLPLVAAQMLGAFLGAILAALERNSRSVVEAGSILYRAGNSQRRGQPHQRNHWYFRFGVHSRRDFREGCSKRRACSGAWTVSRRLPRVGDWSFPRRDHRVRH